MTLLPLVGWLDDFVLFLGPVLLLKTSITSQLMYYGSHNSKEKACALFCVGLTGGRGKIIILDSNG